MLANVLSVYTSLRICDCSTPETKRHGSQQDVQQRRESSAGKIVTSKTQSNLLSRERERLQQKKKENAEREMKQAANSRRIRQPMVVADLKNLTGRKLTGKRGSRDLDGHEDVEPEKKRSCNEDTRFRLAKRPASSLVEHKRKEKDREEARLRLEILTEACRNPEFIKFVRSDNQRVLTVEVGDTLVSGLVKKALPPSRLSNKPLPPPPKQQQHGSMLPPPPPPPPRLALASSSSSGGWSPSMPPPPPVRRDGWDSAKGRVVM